MKNIIRNLLIALDPRKCTSEWYLFALIVFYVVYFVFGLALIGKTLETNPYLVPYFLFGLFSLLISPIIVKTWKLCKNKQN